jgi:DNA-binding XRE family transcriptional regulator
MLTEKDRENFVLERKRRRLSQEDAARLLGCSRMAIANWELKRISQPRRNLAQTIEGLLRVWLNPVADQSEEKGNKVLATEEPTFYLPSVKCPHCRVRVPGPMQRARYCLNCGHGFSLQRCARCGYASISVEAVYCERCGCEL